MRMLSKRESWRDDATDWRQIKAKATSIDCVDLAGASALQCNLSTTSILYIDEKEDRCFDGKRTTLERYNLKRIIIKRRHFLHSP